MGRNIYVASSWRNEYQPGVVAFLRELGHEVYDFRHPPGNMAFSWDKIDADWIEWTPVQWREALQTRVAQDGFASDLAGMEWADTCVLVLPSGRSAHAEAGWMEGKGKTVIAYVPEACEPDLMYLLFDQMVVSERELGAAVSEGSDG